MELLYHYFVESWIALGTVVTHPSPEALAAYAKVVSVYHFPIFAISATGFLLFYGIRALGPTTQKPEKDTFYYVIISPFVLVWSALLYSLLHVVLSGIIRATWFLSVGMWTYPYAWSVIVAVALFVLVTVVLSVLFFRARTREPNGCA